MSVVDPSIPGRFVSGSVPQGLGDRPFGHTRAGGCGRRAGGTRRFVASCFISDPRLPTLSRLTTPNTMQEPARILARRRPWYRVALAPRSWIPALGLALGTAVSILTAVHLHLADHERREMQLAGLANSFGTLLQLHLSACEEALVAAALVAGADGAPDPARWQSLAHQVRAGESGSCVDALAFVPAPEARDRVPLLASARAPAGPTGPDGRFDPWQEPAHRTVLESTRAHGLPRIATDVSWPGVAAAVRMYAWYKPVYRQDSAAASIAERSAALAGHVAVAIRVDDVVAALLHQSPRARLEISSHGSVGDLIDAQARAAATPAVADTGLRERTLRIGGLWWTVRAGLPEPSADEPRRPSPGWIALAPGLLLSMLFAWLARRILSQSAQAHRLVDRYSGEAREREQRLHSVLDGVRDGIFTLDLRGTILGANRAAEEMLGYPEAELRGRSSRMILPPDRIQEYVAGWKQSLSIARTNTDGHGPIEDIELRHRDGRILITRASLNLARAGDDEIIVWIVADVTREREMERRAQESAALNQAIMDAAPIGMMTIGADNRITSANPAIHAMSGHPPGDLVGRHPDVLGDFDEAGLRAAGQVLSISRRPSGDTSGRTAPERDVADAAGLPMEAEWTYSRKDGSHFPAGVIAVPLRRSSGELLGELRMVTDITDRKRAAARIQHMAMHDSLTGLPNRVLLQARATQCMQRARESDGHFALAVLDLDHFKQINDSLGHAIGDEVLKVVAQRLSAAVRDLDTVVRMGGDEFALLLPDVHDDPELGAITQRVLASLADVMVIDENRLHITASIGVATFPAHGEDLTQLLKHADAAMYDTKAQGRAGVSIYDDRMLVQAGDLLELQADLSQALARDQLVLYYQPVVDAATGAVTALEALLRWKHPTRGLVPPLDFIPLAEDTGLIVPIGAWCLRQACSDLVRLRHQQRGPLRVAVNLSARQFRADGLVDHVRDALAAAGLEGSALELEITESALMSTIDRTQAILAELRAMGVRIAIDDFGTGYSSLSYLTNFPVQTVKVDRSFVREITTNKTAALLTGAIVAMAHSLELDVIAEGVETAEQQRHLAALGCELLQGYRFGRPAPIDQMHDVFARARLLQLQALSDPQNMLA